MGILNFPSLFRPKAGPKKYKVEIITRVEQKSFVEVIAEDPTDAAAKAVIVVDVDNPDEFHVVDHRLGKIEQLN